VFIIGNFLVAVAKLLRILLTAYMWIIIIRALISWINPNPYNPAIQFLYGATEPVLSAVRGLLPARIRWSTGIDFSPWLVVLIIIFLQNFLVRSLLELGLRLQ